ncbi:MAG: sensor histidine kinase [Acholeplasmataceae bacterium]
MNSFFRKKNNIKELKDRIDEIEIELSKLEYIIDSLQHGLIVFNNQGLIQIINKYAKKMFDFKYDEIIGKSAIFLTRDIKFQNLIETALNTREEIKEDIIFGTKIYQANFDPIPTTNPELGINQGVVLTLIDVTENRQLAQMKREFFANASHELKSPLTTIIGYQQIIVEKIIDSQEDLEDTQRKILKESYRMNKIITEMLELSKLESATEPQLEKNNLLSILTEILVSYQQQIADKNIKVTTKLEDSYHEINNMHADQIIRNLIDNAIHYNDEGGNLIIELTPEYLIVEDSGIGIAAENISRIFERFYRVDKARSKSEGGTGLGLAIVKHTAGLYGYQVEVSSKLGIGTKIKVIFNK